jgi:hypothetical protein
MQRRAVRRAAAQALATPRYEDAGHRTFGRPVEHDDWAEALEDTGPVPVGVPAYGEKRPIGTRVSPVAAVASPPVFQPLRVVDDVSGAKADEEPAVRDVFEPLDVDEAMFQLRRPRWFRRRLALSALTSVAAVVALVVAVVLVVWLGGAGGETSVPTSASTPPPAPPSGRASSSVVPSPSVVAPPPPAPPPPAAPPPAPAQVGTGQGSYPQYAPPSPTAGPEIGVTRTPATRAPISVAPSPQPAAAPPDKHKRGGGWHF